MWLEVWDSEAQNYHCDVAQTHIDVCANRACERTLAQAIAP